MTAPTIPHGYRLVSGPHTAAEVEDGWTICADWTRSGNRSPAVWAARPDARHVVGNLRAMKGGHLKTVCYSDDPARDIYRIERTP